MVKKEKKFQWCTRTPAFPHNGYMVYFYIGDGQDPHWLQPMTLIYKNTGEIRDAALELDEEVSKNSDFVVAEEAIVIPITFDRQYELRREFWDSPSVHYSHMNRIKAFWSVAHKPSLFQLIVTPTWYRKTLYLSAAIPLYASASDDIVEQFMLTSDYPVDRRAKYAAVYTCGESFHINWETGEMTGRSIYPGQYDSN